jgi:hypothetical protein
MALRILPLMSSTEAACPVSTFRSAGFFVILHPFAFQLSENCMAV